MNRRLIVLIGALSMGVVSADEGMWQPAQMPDIADRVRAAGLELDVATLSDLTAYPMGAVIGLGGCSAAFVSSNGLALTNHHCAYGSIQYHSTPDENLLEAGFVAGNHSEERAAEPNARIYVTVAMQDVTEAVTQAAGSLAGKARYDAIEAAEKRLVVSCEEDPGHRCQVYGFFGGYRYQLVKRLEIRDVRLVYAPSRKIGKFGGDVDNWMWPRHTGDFSLFRAYVSRDGKPVAFSEENVPYQPPHHLKIAPQGLDDGDFAMVIGYPGQTNRYRLSTEVRDAINWSYPSRITLFEDLLATIEGAVGGDEAITLLYEGTVASVNNALKNNRGMLDGFAKDNVVERKSAAEQELREWLQSDQTRSGEYLDDLESLEQEIILQRATRERDFVYGWTRWSGRLLRIASKLYRLSHERQKPDIEREPGFQERDLPRIVGEMEQVQRRWHPKVDQALLARGIQRYARLPANQRVEAFDRAFGLVGDDPDLSGVAIRLDALFSATRLGELEVRQGWVDRPPAAFHQSDDPFIQLAISLYESDIELEAEEKAREGRFQALRSRYMEARLAKQSAGGEAIYDDANNSLRVTYGNVQGYSPRDGITYHPFTTVDGIVQKHTGEWPFDATRRQLTAIANDELGSYIDEQLNTIPVNFLTTVDITGGNSGSPTLNARGELVGVVFDGNYESMNADWSFNPALTRAIHVDIRYLLWVMDHIDGAGHLLAEMGLEINSQH